MSKKSSVKTIDKVNPKVLTFWFLIGIVTVLAIIILIVEFPRRAVRKVGDLEHLVASQVFNQKDDYYFVYVYDSNDKNSFKHKGLNPIIANYANFVNKNFRDGEVYKIYAMDISHKHNKSVIASEHGPTGITDFNDLEIDISSVPVLLKVEIRTLSEIIDKEQDIERKLTDTIVKYKDKKKTEQLQNLMIAIVDRKEFFI